MSKPKVVPVVDVGTVLRKAEIEGLERAVSSEVHSITNNTWTSYVTSKGYTGLTECIEKTKAHLTNISIMAEVLDGLYHRRPMTGLGEASEVESEVSSPPSCDTCIYRTLAVESPRTEFCVRYTIEDSGCSREYNPMIAAARETSALCGPSGRGYEREGGYCD